MQESNLSKVVALVLSLGLLAGCASTPAAKSEDPGDPMEGMNRGFYDFNDAIDRNVLEPVARGYVKARRIRSARASPGFSAT